MQPGLANDCASYGEQVVEFGHQVSWAKWFCKARCAGSVLGIAIAGDVQNLEVGFKREQVRRQVNAAHVGHHDISEQDAKRLAMLAEEGLSLKTDFAILSWPTSML